MTSNNGQLSGTNVSSQGNFDFITTLTEYKWQILIVFVIIGIIVALYMFYKHEQTKKENKND